MDDRPHASLPPLIDTHAHLDFDDFDPDRPEVLGRAREAGLIAIVTIGIEPSDWAPTLQIARETSGVYAAIGVHPNSADQATGPVLEELERLCRAHRGLIVGIGETGLDYYRDYVPHEIQQASFRAHLDLARRLSLPVIVHNRDAHEDVLSTIREHGSGTRGIMHSFSGDVEYARRSIELDYMVSLAGPVTFKKAADKHRVAAEVDLEHLLVETDCPFLTPEPHRGRRNEPAYVRYTAEAIARIRGVTPAEVAAATTTNALRIFRLEGATLQGIDFSNWRTHDAVRLPGNPIGEASI